MGQQWKDRISDQYLARKNSLANQRMGMMEETANSYENLMNNGLNMMGGSLGNILGGLGGGTSTAGTSGVGGITPGQIQGLSTPALTKPVLPSIPNYIS